MIHAFCKLLENDLYNLETNTIHPGVKLCHKLTTDHILLNSFSKMRVNLAAQVCTVIRDESYRPCMLISFHAGP